MPFIRIDLAQGKSPEYRKAVGEVVYQAMRETIDVPENDKFQVITEHPPGGLNLADSYLGNLYSDDVILIQMTISFGRPVEKKQALYRRIADDFAIAHHHHPPRKLRDIQFVSHHDDGHSLFIELLKHTHDFDARSGIKIARWFVRQQKRGLVGKRPGNGHALLLAAGKLARGVAGAVA